jgi:hypothetical protein
MIVSLRGYEIDVVLGVMCSRCQLVVADIVCGEKPNTLTPPRVWAPDVALKCHVCMANDMISMWLIYSEPRIIRTTGDISCDWYSGRYNNGWVIRLN